jgi:hypothetical protein
MKNVSHIKEFEKELEMQGYVELYGIGLWARDPKLEIVDINSGAARVDPFIDASYENFIDICSTPKELRITLGKINVRMASYPIDKVVGILIDSTKAANDKLNNNQLKALLAINFSDLGLKHTSDDIDELFVVANKYLKAKSIDNSQPMDISYVAMEVISNQVIGIASEFIVSQGTIPTPAKEELEALNLTLKVEVESAQEPSSP